MSALPFTVTHRWLALLTPRQGRWFNRHFIAGCCGTRSIEAVQDLRQATFALAYRDGEEA